MRACLYACALLLPALAAAPASAQLALQLDLSPDRVNAGGRVDVVLCLTLEPTGDCPADDVEGTAAYGISATFRLRGESDRGGEAFSDVIEIDAQQTTSTETVRLGPLPAGIWSFSLANVDETPLGSGITLSAPPRLVSFTPVTQVRLEVLQSEVAAGEAVRLRLVPDGVYNRAREFVVRGSSHLGAEADPLTVQISADDWIVERSFMDLPAGLWSFFLTENLVGGNTETVPVLGMPQVRVGFPAITVEGPEVPGVFSSDDISYASLSDSVVLRVSTSTPPRQLVTFMLRGESSSGEFTDVQSVALNPSGSPGTVSFNVPGEGLWAFSIAQQAPANTADSAVLSALALVRVGLPPLRLSGFDSWGTGENVQLRLSSPLAVTGEFMVEGVKGDSSMRNLVSFTQETQKDINFGRLTGGQWSFRVIDSSPTGVADISRAQREVLVEDGMEFTVRFQPEHADTVRYDSTRSRYFVLEDSDARALFRTPNGAPDLNPGSGFCQPDIFIRIQGLTGLGGLEEIAFQAFHGIGERIAGIGSNVICAGRTNEYGFDVTFAAAERYVFSISSFVSTVDDIRTVYVEAPPAVESFSPGQDVIEIGDTAVLNLRLRRSAVVDSRFTVRAQDISAAGSSARFNTIVLLRGESSAAVSFRNMERGVWRFTLVQASPPQLQTPELLATVPARVVAGRLAVRIEAPASVAGEEVVLRLVPDFLLQTNTTFTVTAAGRTAGGLMLASMMQQVHLPADTLSAEAAFSGLSPGSWVFSITGVEPENAELDLSSTAAVRVGGLRAELRAADLDGRVQAGRDVVLLLELPQVLDGDIVFTVRAEGPGGSRVAQLNLRSGVSAVSAVFSGLEPGSWQFTVSASVEAIDTEGVMVTLDVVSRSALSLRVQGARNVAGIGNVLPSDLAVQLRITATPAAIDNAVLTLRAVSGATSQMITATLLADTATVTVDFGVLPDGVWRFSVAETVPGDLFDAAAEVEVEIRRPRGVLSAGRTIARGSSNLPLTVAFDFPAGSAASDNFANRLIAISPAGVQTSRTDSFGAVPPSMSYSFRHDSSALDNAFPDVSRDSGIWTFRHECSAARATCGEGEAVRVRVGRPPDATLEAFPRALAGRPVPISLRLTGETVGDLRLTALAQKSGTEESTSAVMVLPGDQSELDFNFPSLSAGTWVFGLSTQTEHVNPRAGDADGAATELVRRDSLATAQTTVEVVPASSFLVSLSWPGRQETVLTDALLLGREAVLGIAAMPPPLEELEVVLSGSSGMARIESQTIIFRPSAASGVPGATVSGIRRVQPGTVGDWLFSIAVNVPPDGLAAGQVNPAASSVTLTVAPPSAVRLAAPLFASLNQRIALRLELERGLRTQQATFDIDISIDGVSTSTLTVALPGGTTSAESEVLLDALGDWVFTVTAVRGVSPARAVVFADASATVTVTNIPRTTLQVLPPSPVLTGVPVDLRLSLSLPLLSSVSLTVRASHDGAAPTRTWTVELAAQQEGDEAYADVPVFSALTDLEVGLWTFRVDTDDALGLPLNEPQVEVLPPQVNLRALHPEVSGLPEVRAGETVELELAVTESTVRPALVFTLSGSGVRFSGERGVMIPGGIAPVSLAATQSTARVSIPGLATGTWEFAVDAASPSGEVNLDSARTSVRVRLLELRFEADTLQQSVGEGSPVVVAVAAESALPAEIVFGVQGALDGSGEMTPSLSVTIGAGETTGEVTFTDLAAGLWVFSLADENFAGVAQPAGDDARVTVVPLPLASLGAEPLETVRGAAVTLTLGVTAAPMQDTEFSIIGSIEDTVQTQPPLALTLPAGMNTATLSYSPQEPGEWIFRVTTAVPENTVDISAAQAQPVTVRLPSLRTAELQSTAAQGAAVRVGIETDLALLSTVTVTVQALRRGAPPLVRETMVLLQIQERAGSAGEAEFGPGVLLSGDWDITLTAVQPAGRAEVDSGASAAVAVAAPRLRLSAEQPSVLIGAAAQLRVRAEGADGMEAAPDTTVTVTVQGVRRSSGEILTQATTLSAAASSGVVEFAGDELRLGVWQFEASAVPAGFLDLSEMEQVTVNVEPDLLLPATLVVSPSAPATAVRGELVVLSVEVMSTSTIGHGGFSAQVVAVPPVGSTQHLSVPVAAGQSIGTQSFVPARSGPWQFTLESEVTAGSSGLLLDVRSGTLTLMVEDAQLDVSAPPGIDADDLVLVLRYLELCPPPGGCSASGVTEASLRLNLGQGAGPVPLASLRLPEVAGDGVDRGQADIVMLLDYLSGVRGNALFPPGAPVEFREVRLEIIEELLGGSP